MTLNPSLFSSASGEWETPDDLFSQLDAEFVFDHDCAATMRTNKVAGYGGLNYFGPDHPDSRVRDALTVAWDVVHRGYLNPPYGRGIGVWIQKAAESVQAPNGPDLIVVLVPVRTDTRWWCQWATLADEIRYLEGRLTFVGAPSAAPFPSALLVFRRRFDAPYQWHV